MNSRPRFRLISMASNQSKIASFGVENRFLTLQASESSSKYREALFNGLTGTLDCGLWCQMYTKLAWMMLSLEQEQGKD